MNRPRRLPRMSVRRMMMAVAIVGVLMGGARYIQTLRDRSADYRSRAFRFSETGGGMRLQANWMVTTKDGASIFDSQDENYWLVREWANKLTVKYWRLANCPWLTAEPDPPCPGLVHPRPAVDCLAELRARGGPCRRFGDQFYPWWTFPWTWRNRPGPITGVFEPHYSFP